jgi:hypothetical protein
MPSIRNIRELVNIEDPEASPSRGIRFILMDEGPNREASTGKPKARFVLDFDAWHPNRLSRSSCWWTGRTFRLAA